MNFIPPSYDHAPLHCSPSSPLPLIISHPSCLSSLLPLLLSPPTSLLPPGTRVPASRASRRLTPLRERDFPVREFLCVVLLPPIRYGYPDRSPKLGSTRFSGKQKGKQRVPSTLRFRKFPASRENRGCLVLQVLHSGNSLFP